MQRSNKILMSIAAGAFGAFSAFATDYYVSADGSDENDGLSAETPLLTIDAAVSAATDAADVIHVAPGTYATVTQWGPNLKAKLVGAGETRDEVVIQSAGTYRTLRMASGSWLENVTVVGEGTNKADRGGAIEMSGGTVTNCVVRDGTATVSSGNTNGGNIYMTGASVVDGCVVSGGTANKRGGNVYIDGGVLRNCTISGGTSSNVGGNIYLYAGTVSNCTIAGGTATNDGGNVRMNGACAMEDCAISGGTVAATDKKGANVYMDSSARMSRCRLSGGSNAAGYNGGSLCVYNASASVEDCLVEGSGCGGVLLGAISYLYNCTIIDNDKYGIWSWTANQHIFNTVIFGNTSDGAAKDWTGNAATHSSAEFLCNAATSGSLSTSTYPTLVEIDSSAFADYANGDYAPAAGGALVDAGASDPRGASASATDLDGSPRTSGTVDIGCWEYQKPDMTVRLEGATYSQSCAPATVTFSHVVENSAAPDTVAFTYDFGDGSAAETVSDATIAHVYADPGVYTVTITAANTDESIDESAGIVYEGYVRVASSTIYVTPGNSTGQAFPYDTAETGYGNLKTAVQSAEDGWTLLLGEGVHETSDQISFAKALTIRGLGATPVATIVRNTAETPDAYYHRTMEMDNAGGRIENITIENGRVKNQNGGNLRLAAGVVSNCVIRGGLAVADGGNAAGAGVELGSGAILTHCVVSNNTVAGTSSNTGLAGGAVFIPYGSKNGRISNCLIAGNTYTPTDGTVAAGAAGVRFGGSNDNTALENCTIAANTVEGTLSDDSAGVHCTTWYGRLRNNIVAGNIETGKGRFTSIKIDTAHCTYTGNIDDADAMSVFKDFSSGDYRIKASSAAYDAGSTSSLALSPSVDLAGNARVFGKSIDAGCYECFGTPGFCIIIR